MNGQLKSRSVPSRELVVECYENLRCHALALGPLRNGHGLALLKHQGLAAWLKVCSVFTPQSTRASEATVTSSDVVVPRETLSEVTTILAGMSLANLNEVRR